MPARKERISLSLRLVLGPPLQQFPGQQNPESPLGRTLVATYPVPFLKSRILVVEVGRQGDGR